MFFTLELLCNIVLFQRQKGIKNTNSSLSFHSGNEWRLKKIKNNTINHRPFSYVAIKLSGVEKITNENGERVHMSGKKIFNSL